MLSIGLRCPEDATLPHRATHSSHLQSQSFTIADDKSIFAKQQTSKMGHIVSEYEIQFMPQKAIKGQAVANFLADHPVLGTSKLYEDLPRRDRRS